MKRLTFLVFFGLLLYLLSGCTSNTEGPYFGNGFHNGWADQNSIVIWTRLTLNPELNRSGPAFLFPSAKELRRLDEGANTDSIYRAQLPDGYTLDQMEGACPGTEGDKTILKFQHFDVDGNVVHEESFTKKTSGL
jgi:alkaline phosphatase D